MKRFISPIFFLGAFSIAFFFNSCKKDSIITDSSAKVAFSNDTIIFDTVFTTVGSVTKNFTVRNTHNRTINISRIYMAGGTSSNFRMNVDGLNGYDFSNITIEPGDSMYVFVEVTVDPNNSNNPMIITDSIIFETNGNIQDVDLVAWGQDAYFYAPASGSGSSFHTLNCGEVWNNDKPHVIYGWAVVDSACSLTINAGTQVHFHPNSGLLVYKDAQLTVLGNNSSKVVFQGDRLEMNYDEVPGQWQGIWMLTSGACNIDNAIIKNGSFGVRCDTVGTAGLGLTITNSIIENMTSLGMYGNSGAKIDAVNCLVDNIGQYCLAITVGGEYNFNHCTFANDWSYSDRQTPVALITNWYEASPGNNIVRPLDLVFNNSIIFGLQDNEMTLDLQTGSILNYSFTNCNIKTDGNTSGPEYVSCIINQNPTFVDAINQDYHLYNTSNCINAGNLIGGVTNDLDGTARDGSPDIGCYEYQ